MRTTNQAAIYCMFQENGRNFYVLAKRIPERGGFWQPFTGGEEDFDNGDLRKTVIRELKEEIGVVISEKDIINIDNNFSFTDKDGVLKTETCFGVILKTEIKNAINLSSKHDSLIFSTDIEYLKSLMKYEQNRAGLEKFNKFFAVIA